MKVNQSVDADGFRKLLSSDEKWKAIVAYHEAGHAVMSMYNGDPFIHVTCRPENSTGTESPSAGHVLSDEARLYNPIADTDSDQWTKARKMDAMILATLAGDAAVWVLTGRRPRLYLDNGSDWREASLAAEQILRGTQDDAARVSAYLEWLFQIARGILSRKGIAWPAVTALATRLLSDGTLGYAESCAIVKEHAPRFADITLCRKREDIAFYVRCPACGHAVLARYGERLCDKDLCE